MCKACELGKIVVNRCLENENDIDTAKLQKLLVLMHGLHLSKYNTPLFPEKVLIWNCGVAIKEVDTQFREFGNGFKDTLPANLAVLNTENQIINKVLCDFGDKDVFEINKDNRLYYLYEKNHIQDKSIEIENKEIRRVFQLYEEL